MRGCEENGRCANRNRVSERLSGGKQVSKAGHEVILQEELLVDGPEDVARDVFEIGFVERVEGAGFCRDERAEQGKGDRSGQDPERFAEAAEADA